MAVPVFDPNAWALIFIPTDGAPYPHNPEDLFLRTAPGRVIQPYSWVRVLDSQGRESNISFSSPEGLVQAFCEAVFDCELTKGCRLMTIHAKGMALRLLNWHYLQQRARAAVPRFAIPPPITDIVETFHGPAILSYEQRRQFDIQQIRRWVLPESVKSDENSTLSALCQLI